MIAYESLQGQVQRFNSIELHEQKANIKTCWATAMWLAWWRSSMPSRTKPCLTIHHLRVFKKALHLALPRLMNYCGRQRQSFESLVSKNWLDFFYNWKWSTLIALVRNYFLIAHRILSCNLGAWGGIDLPCYCTPVCLFAPMQQLDLDVILKTWSSFLTTCISLENRHCL